MILKVSATIAVAASVGVGNVAAQPKERHTKCFNKQLRQKYYTNYLKVKKIHKKRAPGRNILKYGIKGDKKSTCRQLAKSTRTLRSMVFRGVRLLNTGQPTIPPGQVQTLRAGGTLSAIAACESGGNPQAVSPGGTYRGKYQFDYQTWREVGGSGDPAAASESEQDRRAAMLYTRRGAQPWPVCGR